MSIQYRYDDDSLTAEEFVELFNARWRKKIHTLPALQAIENTTNVTARDGQLLVGCLRLLSDGYLMSIISDVTVHPDYREDSSELRIGEELLRMTSERWPLNLLHATHPASEKMMASIGWSLGYQSFVLKKEERKK